jgi:thiamine biosynthesis protein ThiI
MSHAPGHILLHYHEIALKGKNRPRFISALTRNIREMTRDLAVEEVRALQGRILVTLARPEAGAAVVERLRRIFGIVSISPAWRTAPDLDELEAAILAAIEEAKPALGSFRIQARRGDKRFPVKSPDVNARLGTAVQRMTGARVDLDAADFTVWVELVTEDAFFYFEKVKGPGGLPVGTGGRVVCLLSGGIDSPVAAHRLMKRGCPVVCVHFHSEPYLDRRARDKARELAEILARYQGRVRLHLVPFGEIQKETSVRTLDALRVVLYRRIMARLAERVALEEGALALATGESIGQVASQTLANLAVIERAVEMPILRPLIGMDKTEIIAEAEAIGTFETSILPDQDCCQLFVPRHPATRARRTEVENQEARLDLEALMERALAGREIEEFAAPGFEAGVPAGR